METTNAVQILGALAHEHRLGVFRLLVAAGGEGANAGEIAQALGLPPSSLSFHLAALEAAGLVRATRDGRFIRYCVEPATVRDLLGYLTEECCAGRPELCGLAGARRPVAEQEAQA
ncbi:metalloregulator ArsR/SmtB family transcription factor [Thioalkalivibrio sp. XN8]|uniref:ArsR/SmtB family transcription factor n=1 Tax=Thioalkalivibrio sp. XN8 TaxID=2712863 RepID=UPI0013EA684D|nr:metalloregulator ArsR/SmtB family transcription factor [Thioalkalivibrio sp. XN8]NGP53992.1 helix-turn-helix transcriptional regulator [Thioalkalivibrio sp. XN8]